MKKLCLVLCFFAGFSLFGAQEKIENPQETLSYAALKPANLELKNSYAFTFQPSFIYWQPRCKDMELAEVAVGNDYEELNLNYKFKPGFKILLALDIPSDGWNVFADYTDFRPRLKRTISSDNLVKDFWTASTSLDYFYLKWRLNFDIVSVNVGRPSFWGRNFLVKPFSGLKFGWINTKVIANSSNADTQYPADYKSSSWLVGPQAGCAVKYLLGKYFRFFNDTRLGLAFQSFHLRGKISDSESDIITAKEDVCYISPNVDMNLGFGCGFYNSNKTCYFDLSASYDFTCYFGQQTLRRLSTKEYASDIGPLMLQGLTVNFMFAF